jgi:AhpD family alkylhydroperoxidase
MNEIATLIPGFEAALKGKAATLEAFADLDDALKSARFSPRTRARIGLVVAQQIGCDYCIWAMELMAQRVGLNGEDLVFARMGTAFNAREAAVARLAFRLLASPEPFKGEPAAYGPFTAEEVSEIRGHVAHAVLTCYVLQSIAPRSGAGLTIVRREESK